MASKLFYFAILAVSLPLFSTWVQPVHAQRSREAACETLCGGFSGEGGVQPRTPEICGADYVWSVGLHKCVPVNLKNCPRGYEWGYWEGRCVKIGGRSSGGPSGRERCPPGSAWSDWRWRCVEHSGRSSNLGPSDREKCPPGSAWSDWRWRCVEHSGRSSLGGRSNREKCPPGYAWSDWRWRCIKHSGK